MIAKYSKKFPYAPYLNEDIGFDMSIPDNATDEEMIDAIVRLNSVSEKAFKKLNPHLQSNEPQPIVQQPIPEMQVEKQRYEDRINAFILDIQACTTLGKPNGIDSYRELVMRENNQMLSSIFENRRNEIIKGEIKQIMDATEKLNQKK